MSTPSAIGTRTAGLLLVVASFLGGSVLTGCRAQERRVCTSHVSATDRGLRSGSRPPERTETSPVTPPVRSEAPARDASADGDDPAKTVHERVRARRALRKEIEALDEDLVSLEGEVRHAKPGLRADALADARTARAWRDRLAGDLQAVDRAGDLVWDALKQQIDLDLAEVRPSDEPSCDGDACGTFDL